ncbi:MAG TPA: TIGR03943 family protein [Longilinea sp.]|nr:TIGR03943 family protein [Longilinea sp.]
MSIRLYRNFQSLLLIGIAIFLIVLIATGKLIWYIHPRFVPMTVFAVVVLLLVGLVVFFNGNRKSKEASPETDEVHEHDHEHEHNQSSWRLAIIFIPLAIGVLIPAHPLTASAMAGKGIASGVPITAQSSSSVQFGQAADTRNILQWNGLFNSNADPSTYLGQEANVIGFVYHDPNLKDGQFLVARFALVCCPADAFAVVMVVDWPQSASLPVNQWVKVKGTVQSTQFNGQTLPLIQATSVDKVDQPPQTYLYP